MGGMRARTSTGVGRYGGRAKRKKTSSYRQPSHAAGVSSGSRARYRGGGARTGGFLGQEKKFLDCAWNGVAINASSNGSGGEIQPSTGCTAALSIPAQGDGEQQRDGRKYTIKSVFASGQISTTALSDQNDASEQEGIFLALVLDMQANAATIVSENVYINPSSVTKAMMPMPLRNLANTGRFRILDSVYIPPGGVYSINDTDDVATGASSGSVSNMVAPTFKLSWTGSIDCNSVGTTADVASASDNAIHLIGYCGTNGLTPLVNGKCRVRFYG